MRRARVRKSFEYFSLSVPQGWSHILVTLKNKYYKKSYNPSLPLGFLGAVQGTKTARSGSFTATNHAIAARGGFIDIFPIHFLRRSKPLVKLVRRVQ